MVTCEHNLWVQLVKLPEENKHVNVYLLLSMLMFIYY